jgi:predicted hydrocarbon binding protein
MEQFSWNRLGDIALGRPNLGMNTRVEMYRLMQYSMRNVLGETYGDDVASSLFKKAGKLSGLAFCYEVLDKSLPVNEFIAQVHAKFLEYSIGILRVEKLDPVRLSLIVTNSEDLDCSGLPVTNSTVCDFDEGFLEGIFEVYTGNEYTVKEIDCWCTGDRTCRFSINRMTHE